MADTGRTVWADGFWADDFWSTGFWAGGDAPETPTPTPAGRRRRPRQRYFVEIDGQQFLVNTQEEAQQLLSRASALAERAAEEAADDAAVKRKPERKVTPFKLEPPSVTASPELGLDLSDIRKQLKRIYEDAATAMEIRMLLQRQAEQEARDEEEALFLLM